MLIRAESMVMLQFDILRLHSLLLGMPIYKTINDAKHLLLAAILLPALSYGQKATLVNSTERCWSGGIAGRHGCNYTFSIAFSKIRPRPDTLWIGDSPIELIEKREKPASGGNMKVTTTKNKVQFDITAGTSFDDSYDRNRPHAPGEDPDAPKATPPKKYKGVALLSYKYKGKRYYYEVTKIMEKHPHQNYP